MTPETTARVTPGPLTFEVDDHYPSMMLVVNPHRVVVCRTLGESIEECNGNAALIVAAVNACFALNPTDPLAAAQHLEELVNSIRPAYQLMMRQTGWSEHEMEEWNPILTVLSLVTGKS